MPDYHDTIPYDPLGNDRPTEPMPPLRPEDMTIRLPGGGTPPPPPTTPTAQPPRDPRRRNIVIVAAAVLVVVLVVGGIIVLSGRHGATGCASCASSVATATLAPTGAATTTPATVAPTTGQQTPVTPTTCAGIAAFAQAGAATTGSTNFLAVPFPPNTVAQPPVASESNGFQSRSLPLCTPGVNSATTLQTTFGAGLTTKGWRPAATGSSQGCGNAACWSQTDTSTTPATTQYIGLGPITIAPLFTGTGVPMQSNTTFTFDQSPRPELQWDSTLHVIAGNNIVGALLPAGSYAATTYATLSQATFGPLTTIPRVNGETCGLKATRGYFIKFTIQDVTANQITLTYVVYPYGF